MEAAAGAGLEVAGAGEAESFAEEEDGSPPGASPELLEASLLPSFADALRVALP